MGRIWDPSHFEKRRGALFAGTVPQAGLVLSGEWRGGGGHAGLARAIPETELILGLKFRCRGGGLARLRLGAGLGGRCCGVPRNGNASDDQCCYDVSLYFHDTLLWLACLAGGCWFHKVIHRLCGLSHINHGEMAK